MITEAWEIFLVKTEAKKILSTSALTVSAVTKPPAPFSSISVFDLFSLEQEQEVLVNFLCPLQGLTLNELWLT